MNYTGSLSVAQSRKSYFAYIQEETNMSSVMKVFELSGTLDDAKARQLRKEVNNSLKNGSTIVIIDLKNVTFMESSGLGALILVRQSVQEAGGKLYLSSISKPVKMLLELTSTDSVFEILSDRDEFTRMFDETSTQVEDVKEYADAPLA